MERLITEPAYLDAEPLKSLDEMLEAFFEIRHKAALLREAARAKRRNVDGVDTLFAVAEIFGIEIEIGDVTSDPEDGAALERANRILEACEIFSERVFTGTEP